MPSKKKYNARFPPARIKKIMQTDEEVGKVAAPVPVIISRVLELFVKNLLSNASEFAATNQARTLLSMHLIQAISSEPRLHFLQDTVRQHSKSSDGLDLKRGNSAAEDGEAAASSAISMMQAAPLLQPQLSIDIAASSPSPAVGPPLPSPCLTSPPLATPSAGPVVLEGATRSSVSGRGRGRPRGRPPKRPLPDLNPICGNTAPSPPTKRGRGRPRKQPASPTFVGTDGVSVSNPALSGPFHLSIGQSQPSFSPQDSQQNTRSAGPPALIFSGGLTSPTTFSVSSPGNATANVCSFTVGHPHFGGGSATISSSHIGESQSNVGHDSGSPRASDPSQTSSQANGPMSAPITISRVGAGTSKESSPHPTSNGAKAGIGASDGAALTAPPSQSNPFFSGIKIEIPSLPATNLPFSISNPYGVSISPVFSPTSCDKTQSEVSSRETKQQKALPLEHRRGSHSDSITTPQLDSTNGKAKSVPSFTFGGRGVGEGVASSPSVASSGACSPQVSLSGELVSGPLDFSTTTGSLQGRCIQTAAASNLDEDYDS